MRTNHIEDTKNILLLHNNNAKKYQHIRTDSVRCVVGVRKVKKWEERQESGKEKGMDVYKAIVMQVQLRIKKFIDTLEK